MELEDLYKLKKLSVVIESFLLKNKLYMGNSRQSVWLKNICTNR